MCGGFRYDALSCSPLRFCQLQDSAGGVNPRTLSQRLSMLESEGIVAKQVFDERSLHTEYRLTPKGIDVLPIIRSMREWSAKYPTRQAKRRLASMT
ncbi:helix-turn-helix domain-containing protein [Marispirochaeta sp.]|uniref:winged helix-turn-helix transcriptional regulator n=1 Tax=Marispirochaeta sp. TaxID=2038653 RepID=UPI0029C6C5DC|nr:helix-turn-helix domain-containing protein [Marispirochaeta sp.]